MRLTLHEAQERVAKIERDNGVPFAVDWQDPLTSVLTLAAEARLVSHLSSRGIALLEVRLAVAAYLRHMLFEEGKAFADAAAVRHLRDEGRRLSDAADEIDYPAGEAISRCADEIEQGYHYAEEAHR